VATKEPKGQEPLLLSRFRLLTSNHSKNLEIAALLAEARNIHALMRWPNNDAFFHRSGTGDCSNLVQGFKLMPLASSFSSPFLRCSNASSAVSAKCSWLASSSEIMP